MAAVVVQWLQLGQLLYCTVKCTAGDLASTPSVVEATPLDYFLSLLKMLSADLVIVEQNLLSLLELQEILTRSA